MATWYVRKSGSNSNAGTSAGAAWLTIGHALTNGSGVNPGDAIYIGAGVYRETDTVGTAIAGSSGGGSINIIGDVDGAKTGDAGEVRWTAYTTNDTTAPASVVLLTIGSQSYLSFSLITMVGGAANPSMISATGSTNVSFTDCTFLDMASITVSGWSVTGPATGAATSWTIDRCTFVSAKEYNTLSFILPTTNSGSADYDAMIVIRNSFFISECGGGSGGLITMTTSGSNTYKGGGVRVYDCTILTTSIVFWANSASLSTNVPCEIHNSVLVSGSIQANTSGQIIETYNLIYSSSPRNNVTAGTGSISNGSYAPMFEVGQSYKYGAGTIRPFMAPTANSPALGFGLGGTGGNYPTVDWMNRPRPSGGGSASYAAGYLERHDFAVQDTSTYPSGYTSSGKLVGPGDQFLNVPVDAVSTTLAIQVQMSSGYGGTSYATATILANGELGVATQTKTCSSTLGSFQTLAFSGFTPSKQGWVVVQVTSYDTSGTGNVWFGALT